MAIYWFQMNDLGCFIRSPQHRGLRTLDLRSGLDLGKYNMLDRILVPHEHLSKKKR